MNTFQIYEDFKATLGDAAAKSLAQTLGAMFEELKDTVTKEDFRILRESVDANVSRLEGAIARLAEGQEKLFEAQARTDARMGELVEAQARTDARMAELAEGQAKLVEAQARTDARMAELTEGQAKLVEAQARTDARMAELAEGQAKLVEAQARTEQQIGTLTEAMNRLANRTDAVVGHTFELRFRDRLTAYLGRFLRRGKVIGNDLLLDAIEPCVTTEEVEDFLRADIVAKGLVNGAETYVVVEVSSTGDTSDVLRAERRSAILRKAGLAAIPLVACGAILPEALEIARRSGVHVWCNGSMVDAAA
jgi:DNA repair exonuclease SbcCD ATPase subunit